MAIDDDYTEERLAEYDAAAIAQDDVIVMGFVTVVRRLRREAMGMRAQLRQANGSKCHADMLLRRVVTLWEYVSSRHDEEDACAFQRELDAADGQLIEDVRRHLSPEVYGALRAERSKPMTEEWRKHDRPCQPCANCGADLFEKFWGNGGWAKTDKATGRTHDPTDCIRSLRETKHTLEVAIAAGTRVATTALEALESIAKDSSGREPLAAAYARGVLEELGNPG